MRKKRLSDLYTLLPKRPYGNWPPFEEKPEQVRRWYHSIRGPRQQAGTLWVVAGVVSEVRPESIGRVLGIGLRVAGRMAGQRMRSQSEPATALYHADSPSQGTAAQGNAARARVAGKTTRQMGRGMAGFLKPFRTVGGKLWLEVTGAFFFLPVLAFAPVLWRTRGSWHQGPDHRTFLAAAVIIVMFSYLGVTSFWRAGRRR